MTPDFRILADDQDVTEKIRIGLVSLRLTDKAGMEADEVEITIADPTNALRLPRRGVVLTVAIGWAGQDLVDKGSFVVDHTGEDGPLDTIRITAKAADFRDAIKDQRQEAYHDTTLGTVLTAIAERNGLTPSIHPDLAAKPIAHLDQTTESDVHLMTRLAKDYGAVGTIKNGALVFVPKGTGQTGSGAALPTVTIVRADTDRHSFSASDREGSQTGVKAQYHDFDGGETRTALAGAEGSVTTLKRLYPTEAAAKEAAKAAHDRAQAESHEITLTLAAGRPDVLAGSPLTLAGWREEITSLSWIAGDITHTIEAGGYTTEIKASDQTDSAGGAKSKDDLTWVDEVQAF